MALPERCIIQALPPPGEGVQQPSRKHAVLVRMSGDAMDALEKLDAGAKIDFEFGKETVSSLPLV